VTSKAYPLLTSRAYAPLYAPTDASYTRSPSNPIITPNQSWEQDTLVEPCAMWSAADGFRLWMRGGWNGPYAFTLATAPATADPLDPASWTKRTSPIWGNGGSGESRSIALPWVTRRLGVYYFSGVKNPFGTGSTSMIFGTSSDGITVTTQSSSMSLPGGTNLWGNRVTWWDGTQWQALVEASPTGSFWRIYRYTSPDHLTWTIANSGTAFGSLAVAAGGAYGAPRFAVHGESIIPIHDGKARLFYHAAPGAGNLPTNIRYAETSDLTLATDSWVQGSGDVLTHLGTGFEIDQVAGPCPLVVGARVFLFYDGDDNVAQKARIGVASATAL
jgi:hypothetical protein